MAKLILQRSFPMLSVILAAASMAVAQTHVITHVSRISTQQFQTIVITGSGFGTDAPYTGDSAYISLLDQTTPPAWQAGYTPFNDTVTLIVQKMGGFENRPRRLLRRLGGISLQAQHRGFGTGGGLECPIG